MDSGLDPDILQRDQIKAWLQTKIIIQIYAIDDRISYRHMQNFYFKSKQILSIPISRDIG